MSSLSYDNLALSLLFALLLPNLLLVEAEDDTAESSANPEALSSAVIHLSKIQELKPRRPVETPPTEYLPYPPPDNYQWPPGMNAGNENPQYVLFSSPLSKRLIHSYLRHMATFGTNDTNLLNPPDQANSTPQQDGTQVNPAPAPVPPAPKDQQPPLPFTPLSSSTSSPRA